MTKKEFIGNYLNKKMKNHGLPMGLEYYNLLGKHEEDAEKKWKFKIKKDKNIKQKIILNDKIRKILYQNSHDDSECLRIKFEDIDKVINLIVKCSI